MLISVIFGLFRPKVNFSGKINKKLRQKVDFFLEKGSSTSVDLHTVLNDLKDLPRVNAKVRGA